MADLKARLKPKREWRTGLCDWSAGPDGRNRCCYTLFCGPCAYGRMVEQDDTPIGVPGKGTCLGGALMWIANPPLTVAIADNALRHAEGINGHWLVDLWNGIMCLPCAQCRQAREVDLHEEH